MSSNEANQQLKKLVEIACASYLVKLRTVFGE